MLKLLKIEWLKIRKYRAFLILLALFVFSLFGISYITSATFRSFGQAFPEVEPGQPSGEQLTGILFGHPFAFPEMWQTVAYLSSFLLFIPGLIVILLTANEFSFRTHRQVVIDGMSRTQFIAGKMALIVAMAVCITVLAAIVAIFFGLQGPSDFSFNGAQYIPWFFIQSLSYMSLALVTVMFFKRSGISIGIYFLYAFIVENVLAILINYRLLDGAGYFLPLKSADKLIPAPTTLGRMMAGDLPDTAWLVTASLAWIALFLWYSMYRFRTTDL